MAQRPGDKHILCSAFYPQPIELPKNHRLHPSARRCPRRLRAPTTSGLVVPTAQRVTGGAPNDTRHPALHSAPPLHTHSTHTTSDPRFGFCIHSSFRTAGPCNHGNRRSPRTWLDLDLSSDGQASLTRMDGQLERTRRRHQLPPLSHLHLQDSCHLPSKAREGKDISDSCARPPCSLPATVPILSTQKATEAQLPAQHLAWCCCFSPRPAPSSNISQCLFCCDGMTLLLLHCCVDLYLWFKKDTKCVTKRAWRTT